MIKGVRDVRIRSRFLRSTRLDGLQDKTDLAHSIVLHETGETILTNVISDICSGQQRAFTWTGAYGTGKSTLALYLSLLLSCHSSDRLTLKPPGSAVPFRKICKVIPDAPSPWLVIDLVGDSSSLEEALRRKIFEVFPKLEEGLPVAHLIKEIIGNAAREYSGLLIIIDELGRNLEYSVQQGQSLHCLQEIAEIFSRSEFPCGLIGLLHQTFYEYLPRSERHKRQEWEKIQGRFSDIPLGLSVEESVGLIGAAIQGRVPLEEDRSLVDLCCGALKGGRLNLNKRLPKLLNDCLPMHPFSVILLCVISRQRFGQNERSLFSFLASNEAEGLQDFSRQVGEEIPPYYTLDRLFDYLQINLGRNIASIEGLGQRWSDAEECVIRSEQISETSQSVAKVIAMAEVFGRAINFVADANIIEKALPHIPSSEVKDAIADLEHRSVIEYRAYKSGYALSLGSDIDLDAELAKLRANLSVDDIEIDFKTIANINPVIAKRHYHVTGTLRYFDTRIISVSQIQTQTLPPLEDLYDGAFLLFLGDPSEIDINLEDQESLLHSLGWSSENRPLLCSVLKDPNNLYQQAMEVTAVKRLSSSLVELQNDRVARRRLTTLDEDTERELINRVSVALQQASWRYQNKRLINAPLSAVASSVCDEAYKDGPKIHNELVNRRKPSAVASKARRTMMNLMISNNETPRLGIEKYPPELGIYLSVVENNALFPSAESQNSNGKPELFENLFALAEAKIRSAEVTSLITAEDIYSDWKAPPFGVREGVAPILLLSRLLENSNKIAPYLDGVFVTEFDDLFVERLCKSPKTITFRWAFLDGVHEGYVKSLESLTQERFRTKSSLTPLQIAREWVQYALDLPNFSKSYQGNGTIPVSDETLSFRGQLLLARDPLKLLFDDLPKAFGVDFREKGCIETINTKIKQSFEELDNLFPALCKELKRHIVMEFPLSGGDNPIASIQKIARSLKKQSFDQTMDRFVSLLGDELNDDEWVEKIAGMAAQKPVRRWIDADIIEAKIRLSNIAHRLRSIVALNGAGMSHLDGGNIVSLGTKKLSGEIETMHSLIMTDFNDAEIQKLHQAIGDLLDRAEADDDKKISVLSEILSGIMRKRESVI